MKTVTFTVYSNGDVTPIQTTNANVGDKVEIKAGDHPHYSNHIYAMWNGENCCNKIFGHHHEYLQVGHHYEIHHPGPYPEGYSITTTASSTVPQTGTNGDLRVGSTGGDDNLGNRK